MYSSSLPDPASFAIPANPPEWFPKKRAHSQNLYRTLPSVSSCTVCNEPGLVPVVPSGNPYARIAVVFPQPKVKVETIRELLKVQKSTWFPLFLRLMLHPHNCWLTSSTLCYSSVDKKKVKRESILSTCVSQWKEKEFSKLQKLKVILTIGVPSTRIFLPKVGSIPDSFTLFRFDRPEKDMFIIPLPDPHSFVFSPDKEVLFFRTLDSTRHFLASLRSNNGKKAY